MGVHPACVRARPDHSSDRNPTQKKNCLFTHWCLSHDNGQISILFSNFACWTRWLATDEKCYASNCLTRWICLPEGYPACNSETKRPLFWFLHSVTFFDWVRLVGMEINTALCIWCSLISSPHCLQVEASNVSVRACVRRRVRARLRTQRSEHNNSSRHEGLFNYFCEPDRKDMETVWNDSEDTERGKTKSTEVLLSLWFWKYVHMFEHDKETFSSLLLWSILPDLQIFTTMLLWCCSHLRF